MKKYAVLIMAAVFLLTAETLFQVKDSDDNVVLDVSKDGLRVYNEGDLLMEISSSDIRAFIDNDPQKGLARSFSVTTSSSSKGETNVFEISKDATQMREGDQGQQYTDFSPQNVFLGLNAGASTTPGSPNAHSGITNIFLGNESGINNTSGGFNIMIGDKSGLNNTTGGNNLFIGNNSGESNTTGGYNLFIGNESGKNNTATNNMFAGHNSGYSNTTGGGNLFLGTDAGAQNTQGGSNVFVGQQTGVYNTHGNNNTFIGRWSGNANQLYSHDNTYLGFSSGSGQSTGSRNTYIGSNSGRTKTGGVHNTFLGSGTGYNNSGGSSNVFLGYQAGYNETGSNKLYIANSSTSTPLIYGDFSASALTVNGTLTATGNTSVGGTYLRIVGDPGTGTTPTNYVYQGGFANSTGKQFAFAINDALWVTSNAWIDGTLNSKGIEASVDEKSGLAANFKGNVNVTGVVSKSSDEIKIDHPLDPENKYLTHAGVSSDQMSNIYHGNVELDNEGKATVRIEAWIESVNKDFRYQLTSIGAPGPNLYIAREISGNSFEIAGGVPGSKVSWQVTGIRNDNYAKALSFQTEEFKREEERGFYIHPEAFGKPSEMSIEYQREKKLEQIKEGI